MDGARLSPQSKPDLGQFDWSDPFRLAAQLTDEERMLQDAAAAYAAEKLAPRVTQAYREEVTDPAQHADGAASARNQPHSHLRHAEPVAGARPRLG